ncbi:Cell death protease [Serendipita sp. 401]|nr:Cell death protease [Serendipita sp. 401]
MFIGTLRIILLLCSLWPVEAAPTSQTTPAAASFHVDTSTLPNFHRLPSSPPLHIWAGHLLAEPANFVPPGPNETPHPNLPVQSHLYFVLIKARRPSDRERTILWFNGGPGCSSFDGLMMEVGPWRMDAQGELREIEGGWEEYANIVYIDQPVGTGFSYGSTDKYLSELTQISGPVLEFLRNFYKVFPELAGTDTYLAGESFAGQFIPYIADALLEATDVPAPLKGLAIGNGWIDSRAQYPAFVEFGLKAGLYKPGSPEHRHAQEAMDKCQKELDKLPPTQNPVSLGVCEHVMGAVLASYTKQHSDGTSTCMNVYDMRLTDSYPSCGMTWPPDLAQITPWLRKHSVVNALHAEAKDAAWQECSGQVGMVLRAKHSEASVKLLPKILEKIPILIFAGDQDVICNYVGQERFIEKLEWQGSTGLGTAPIVPWTVNGTAAGTWQSARNLTYVKIFQASHMVGFDVPHVAHDMMLRFMNVDFSRLNAGTAGRIESSLGDEEKSSIIPGGGKLSEVELKAKWQAYYNAGTVALIVVLIAVTIGTILYCRSRKKPRESRIMLGANGGTEEENIPLNRSQSDLEESRRRKGKGRAVHTVEPIEEETMFEIGSDGEEKYPS